MRTSLKVFLSFISHVLFVVTAYHIIILLKFEKYINFTVFDLLHWIIWMALGLELIIAFVLYIREEKAKQELEQKDAIGNKE